MKINYNINLIIMGKLEYFEYNFKLKKPAPVLNSTIKNRSGIYIIIKKNITTYGVAEVAPLKGLNKETIKDILPILKSLSQQEIEFTEDYFKSLYTCYSNYPSLIFALETAFLMIKTNEQLSPIKTHYFTTLPPINYPQKNILIKYKIGLKDTKADLKEINKLIETIPQVKFRFDVNKRLSLQESCDFFNKINKQNIDYVEDPCQETELEEFFKKTGINYALDSPKQTKSPKPYLGLNTLIIKPTLIGTINSIKKLKESYQVNRLILSSSYETKIGLNGLATYARLLSPNETHGINTEHFFEYSTTPHPINKFQPSSKTKLINWMLKQC